MPSVSKILKILCGGLAGGTLFTVFAFASFSAHVDRTVAEPQQVPFVWLVFWFGLGFLTGSTSTAIVLNDIERRRGIFSIPRARHRRFELERGDRRSQPVRRSTRTGGDEQRRVSLTVEYQGTCISEEEQHSRYLYQRSRVEEILAISIRDLSPVFSEEASSERDPSSPTSESPGQAESRFSVVYTEETETRTPSSSKASPLQSPDNTQLQSSSGLQLETYDSSARELQSPPSSRLRESTRRARDPLASKEVEMGRPVRRRGTIKRI